MISLSLHRIARRQTQLPILYDRPRIQAQKEMEDQVHSMSAKSRTQAGRLVERFRQESKRDRRTVSPP